MIEAFQFGSYGADPLACKGVKEEIGVLAVDLIAKAAFDRLESDRMSGPAHRCTGRMRRDCACVGV